MRRRGPAPRRPPLPALRIDEPSMPVPLIDLTADYRELKAEIDEAIARVIARAAFVGGEEMQLFERELAAFVGVRRAVGLGNCSDALELALQALGVGPGDRVLTVPFTFAATVEAIVRVGAEPVLVDIDERDFTIDVDAAARAARPRQKIKAIIAVHLYGHPADLDRPAAAGSPARRGPDRGRRAGARRLVLTCRGSAAGSEASATPACFSFYPTKNLGAMGDGGALVTDSDEIARRVWLLANHGDAGKYEHVIANGGNSRLDGIQAAVLRVKLRHLDAWNARRRRGAAAYTRLLADLPVLLPRERARGGIGLSPVHDPRRRPRRAARGPRRARHRQRRPLPAVRSISRKDFATSPPQRAPSRWPSAAPREVLSLPMSPHLDDAAIEQVSAALHAACC